MYRSGVQEPLVVDAERVEARGDDPAQRLREGQHLERPGAAGARRRIRAARGRRASARTRRSTAGCPTRCRRSPAVRSAGNAASPASPSRVRASRRPRAAASASRVAKCLPPPQSGRRLEQLRTRGRDDKIGTSRAPGEILDEVEQPVVGPLEVLEDEDGQRSTASASRKRRHAAKAEPRSSPRRLRRVLRARRAIAGGRRCGSHRPCSGPGRRRPHELVRRCRSAVGLEHAGLALDDLAQRPERDPLPVGRRAARPQGDQRRSSRRCAGRARRRGGSCRSPARRPSSRVAARAGATRRGCRAGARARRAADQRLARGLWATPRPRRASGAIALPHGDGVGLALGIDGLELARTR